MDILKKIILYGFVFVAFLLLVKVVMLEVYPDFDVYYSGSLLFLRGLNPYIRPESSFVNYVYPPFTLLFFSPFVLFSLPLASKLWTIFSLLFFFGAMWVLARILKLTIRSTVFLLILGFVMFSFPVKFTLGMGQINLFILLVVLLGIYFLKQKKDVWAGIFFGLAITIKFFPVLLLPYFFVRKKWTVFFSALLTVVVIWVLSLIFVWVEFHIYFLKYVLPGILHASQTAYYNQALSGVLARAVGNSPFFELLKFMISIVMVAMTFGVFLVKSKRKDFMLLEVSMIITLSLMINSFSWQHHFVWLIFSFALLFSAIKRETLFIKILFIVSIIFVAGNIKNPAMLPVFMQSHVFYGTFILWLLHIRLLRSKHV